MYVCVCVYILTAVAYNNMIPSEIQLGTPGHVQVHTGTRWIQFLALVA